MAVTAHTTILKILLSQHFPHSALLIVFTHMPCSLDSALGREVSHHSFIQSGFTEGLVCVRLSSRPWDTAVNEKAVNELGLQAWGGRTAEWPRNRDVHHTC